MYLKRWRQPKEFAQDVIAGILKFLKFPAFVWLKEFDIEAPGGRAIVQIFRDDYGFVINVGNYHLWFDAYGRLTCGGYDYGAKRSPLAEPVFGGMVARGCEPINGDGELLR